MSPLALLLTATSFAALAEPATATQYAAAAERQYADGAYSAASASYAAAFDLEAEPDHLYGWAQAERRAGNCPRAVELYRQYLDLAISSAAKAAAEKNILRCGANVEPVADVQAPPPAVDPPPTDDPAHRRAWTHDVPAISLLATGGAIGVVAVVLAVGSGNQRRAAENADIEADYATHAERSGVLRTGAVVCASIGGALVVGGIVRYIVVARRHRSERITWQPGLGVRF